MGLPSFCRDKCRDYKACKEVCDYIDRVADGNKPLREYLAGLDMERVSNRDYKQSLIDNQDARTLATKKTMLDIRTIPDPRRRLIASALHAGLTIEQLSSILQITRRHIYRVARVEIRQYKKAPR